MKPHTPKSQCAAILRWLQRGYRLTAIDALNKFGCFRLSARINDLRDEGHHIKTATIKRDGKRFAEYSL